MLHKCRREEMYFWMESVLCLGFFFFFIMWTSKAKGYSFLINKLHGYSLWGNNSTSALPHLTLHLCTVDHCPTTALPVMPYLDTLSTHECNHSICWSQIKCQDADAMFSAGAGHFSGWESSPIGIQMSSNAAEGRAEASCLCKIREVIILWWRVDWICWGCCHPTSALYAGDTVFSSWTCQAIL